MPMSGSHKVYLKTAAGEGLMYAGPLSPRILAGEMSCQSMPFGLKFWSDGTVQTDKGRILPGAICWFEPESEAV